MISGIGSSILLLIKFALSSLKSWCFFPWGSMIINRHVSWIQIHFYCCQTLWSSKMILCVSTWRACLEAIAYWATLVPQIDCCRWNMLQILGCLIFFLLDMYFNNITMGSRTLMQQEGTRWGAGGSHLPNGSPGMLLLKPLLKFSLAAQHCHCWCVAAADAEQSPASCRTKWDWNGIDKPHIHFFHQKLDNLDTLEPMFWFQSSIWILILMGFIYFPTLFVWYMFTSQNSTLPTVDFSSSTIQFRQCSQILSAIEMYLYPANISILNLLMIMDPQGFYLHRTGKLFVFEIIYLWVI